ncbi:nucleolin-like [Procambarus clarkii]|uniref:nucleolin-like n=1 Tax=Procambarus clarkii TaxID=6728 RepID=UPI003742B09B
MSSESGSENDSCCVTCCQCPCGCALNCDTCWKRTRAGAYYGARCHPSYLRRRHCQYPSLSDLEASEEEEVSEVLLQEATTEQVVIEDASEEEEEEEVLDKDGLAGEVPVRKCRCRKVLAKVFARKAAGKKGGPVEEGPEDQEEGPEDQEEVAEDQEEVAEDQEEVAEDQEEIPEDQEHVTEDQVAAVKKAFPKKFLGKKKAAEDGPEEQQQVPMKKAFPKKFIGKKKATEEDWSRGTTCRSEDLAQERSEPG